MLNVRNQHGKASYLDISGQIGTLKLRIAKPRVDEVRTTQVCVLELGSGQVDASTR